MSKNKEIEKLIYSNCSNPQKVRLYNGVIGAYEYKDVPCGKCYHCKITRINEWVTRMTIEANYNKFVYFGTLTYGSKCITTYSQECLGMYTDFNQNQVKTYTPMVLRYDHVQKFFKRLRKNTGVKFQYAVCGEYGGTYSRPHYHYIIFTNQPISKLQIYKAWTAPSIKDSSKRIVIGKVEHRDIKNEPYITTKNGDVSDVYKYVCKYIQKSDFKFDELTNYKQHKKLYHYEFKKATLLCRKHDAYIQSKKITNFEEYKRAFSPFFRCSKKPALGYKYVQDHIGEFKEGNLRLFGLSKENIFPQYFTRKVKESISVLRPKSTTNQGFCSYARLPKMESLLSDVINSISIGEDTQQIVQLFRYQGGKCYLSTERGFDDLEKYEGRYIEYSFPSEYLSFLDYKNKVFYEFSGESYKLYSKVTGEYIGDSSLEDVLNLIKYYYYELVDKLLIKFYIKGQISSNKKASIIDEFGGITKYEEYKENLHEQKLNVVNMRQSRYKQTKTFE